ncbi:MAG: nucleotidyltransferase domain-containing protein [archaeon]
MFINNNTYKILKIFLDDSLEEFGLREISRKTKISPASVKQHLKKLEEENLIEKIIKKDRPLFISKREDKKFISLQKLSIIYELEQTGLLEFLEEKLSPKAIILYGSYAKGEAVKNSDIDIFIIGKENKINLSIYEKKLGKQVHLLFEENPKKIPNELKNNLINGTILRGYLEII